MKMKEASPPGDTDVPGRVKGGRYSTGNSSRKLVQFLDDEICAIHFLSDLATTLAPTEPPNQGQSATDRTNSLHAVCPNRS